MGTWDWDSHRIPSNGQTTSSGFTACRRVRSTAPSTVTNAKSTPTIASACWLAVRRAIEDGVPYDVEYRIVAPDGTVRWVEGKGRVEFRRSRPVRMSGVCMIVTRRKEAELARLASAEEGEPAEGRVPGHAVARAAHAAQRDPRLGRRCCQRRRTIARARCDRRSTSSGATRELQAQLIEDILDVSRIITGKLEIDRAPVHAGQLLDTVISGLLPAADARQILVSRLIADDLPPTEGDPQRLQQVFSNVLSNAIKFTPDGGAIAVTCESYGDGTLVEFTDSGAGIAPEFLPYVFDRFRQGDSRATRKQGGLGLGLAIARHIIEAHGGTIEAHSAGQGQGTTIRIQLPGANALAIDPRLSTVERRQPELRLDGTTIVVVDDQPDSGDLLAELLTRTGARVLGYTCAVDAMQSLAARQPDLLIADIAMPEIDGYELIRRVRERHPRVPAIAVSAYARPQDRKRAMDAGYNSYCAKPVDAGQLLRIVRDVLAVGRR